MFRRLLPRVVQNDRFRPIVRLKADGAQGNLAQVRARLARCSQL